MGRVRGALILVAIAAIAVGVGLAATGGGGTKPRAAHHVVLHAKPRPHRRPASLALPGQLPARTVAVPILMYHRIDLLKAGLPQITRSLTVDPADFAAQMRWLASHGYHTLSQRQLFDALELGAALPAKPVLLTFDDGYRDVFGKAMPVLSQLHMHATAYVITSRISGPDPSFLTWGRITGLEQHGFDIGSHTVHHLELTGLSDSQAFQELRDSKATLEQHLHHPVQWFAYPAGAENDHAAALVRQVGYVLAVTTHPGRAQDARRPLQLFRYEILDTTGVAGLASILGARQ